MRPACAQTGEAWLIHGERNTMQALGMRLLLTGSIAAFVAFLGVSKADAHTCGSTCNQIQRACSHSAKAARKVSLAQCDLGRDTCRADCEFDPDCPGNFICNDARVLCRADAHTTRLQAREACRVVRASCPPESCVDPIDARCVQACKSDERDCGFREKKAAIACKRACPRDNGRRACIRGCKRELNQKLGPCSDGEALCLGVCIGILPPP